MNYITLKAGDVRQEKDEYRKDRSTNMYCHGSYNSWEQKRHERLPRKTPEKTWDSWKQVSLISHIILPSDLIHTEYRRPTLL